MFCSNCGNELRAGDKFCGKCGNEIHQPEMLSEVQGEATEAGDDSGKESKKRYVKRVLIVLLAVVVLLGIGICVRNNVQESGRVTSSAGKEETESDQEEHDKRYVYTGNYDEAKNNLSSLGYVLKDEEEITVDIDRDGMEETILFYIDGKEAYIEWNDEKAYVYSCNALCEDYVIILPVGNDMAGFIFTKRNESKDASFSQMICFYKGKCNSECEFSLEGSVADGGLIVEDDYAVHYDWQTSSEHVFYNGKIYDSVSW